MAKAVQILSVCEKALASLESILALPEDEIVRDASIQRFEYTVETFWKMLKAYLYEQEGIECNSPKSCMRKAFEINLLNESDAGVALQMCDDRNLTSHTYIEAIAKIIYSRLKIYVTLMKNTLNGVRIRI